MAEAEHVMPDEHARGGAADGQRHLTTKIGIDTEELTGRTFPYQFDSSLVEDVDLVAATPGADINWLEDVHLMTEDDVPAVFDRYTNAFLKIYFEIPAGREDEYARRFSSPTCARATPTASGSSASTRSSPSPNSARGGRTPPPSARTGNRRFRRTGTGPQGTSV